MTDENKIRVLANALFTILAEAQEPIIKVYAQSALDETKGIPDKVEAIKYFSQEEADRFAISFSAWAGYDPQAATYKGAGISAHGLLEKYKSRPYINPDISNIQS
jgi:predicted Zn-dependent protease